MIYPEDKWKTVFDVFIAVLTLYFCLSVPYKIGFEPEVPSWLLYVELSFDCCFFIDIALRFRCAFWNDIVLVDDWLAIAKSYLKG